MKNIITTLFLIVFCGLILSFSLRGVLGSPDEASINSTYWTDNGPLELSPERGKFALTYSFIENHSLNFSVPIARFTTPDLGYYAGNYVSLFAPGVSFITIPGYVIGKVLGASQAGTYAIIAVFALLNVLLIRLILRKLGVNEFLAVFSGLSFLFATPAFAYGVSLYQHHISTFLILLSVYLLIKFKGAWPLLGVWFLLAISLTVDYPNFFMTLPIGIYGLGRLVYGKVSENKAKLVINLVGFLTVISALLPILFFTWFNNASYGSPFQLAGTVPSVRAIDDQGNPAAPKAVGADEDLTGYVDPEKQKKSAVGFFLTRNMLNGFYLHFFSPDRGMIYYAPMMLLGLIGIFYLYKKHAAVAALLISIMGMNILLYSMWNDPWGGWAFGSRYLIPSYAILSIFLGFALLHLNRYILFTLLFLSLFTYSIAVNTVGAITSSRNPPQVETLALEKLSGVEQKYTYARNFDMLNVDKTKSFVFNTVAYKYLTAWQYYLILVTLIGIAGAGLLISDRFLTKGGLNVKS